MTHPILEGIKCIVFDIDDTLYLERDYAKSGFEVVGEWVDRELRIGGFSEVAWQIFEAGTRQTIFNEALDALDINYDLDMIKKMVQIYRSHEPQIELLPDAADRLNQLAAHPANFQLAALTGGPLVCQKAKVRALELEETLNPIVYAQQWGPEFDKPHARAFEEIEKLTGFSGAECVYLADNPHKDFIAPTQLGWRTVRVRRQGGLHEAQPNITPVDLTLSMLSDLI
ncbi:HAD family hydrolase [Bradymonas sediminis]|nr:HAD family hydrolase [Bradymonas sediminis]TDP73705.1 putative hydrolase of the HAD superfamily [Bradymonas sediminis]